MAYDDFEDETLDRWDNTISTGGTPSNTTLAAKFGARGCRLTMDGANDAASCRMVNLEENAASGNYYTWVRTSNAAKSECAFAILGQTVGHELGHMVWRISELITYSGAVRNDFAAKLDSNTWYRFRITYSNTTDLVSYYLYDSNNNFIESILNVTPTDNEDIGQTRFIAWDRDTSSQTIDFDNTCYTSTDEPVPSVQFMAMRKYL